LLNWYASHRRDLPWRTPIGSVAGARPDPYHVLVSETMLQQTQVATVVPFFNRFIERFPTLVGLAAAQEQQVLRLWQGLGYYSRARNLLRTARLVVRDHRGELPSDLTNLMNLPGIGRYTAGAIASIAFGRPAPILDGNVARVICRLKAVRGDPRERATAVRLWREAETMLPTGKLAPLVGDFNSALMELGATVCTPRNPDCAACPLRRDCVASRRGLAHRIPPPRKSRVTQLVRRSIFCVCRERVGGKREWLIEKRPARGRWAGLWQFPTGAAVGSELLRGCRPLGKIRHALTHRRYVFDVYLAHQTVGNGQKELVRRWVSEAVLDEYPMSKPQLLAGEMARAVVKMTAGVG
jgi:A/G-specific adenine glycosylase